MSPATTSERTHEGRPIARFLERESLRTVDLAKAADVTWMTAHKWVNGETFPTTKHLGRIVAWLRKNGIEPTLDDFVEVAA